MTLTPLKSNRQKRREHADRAAAWRDVVRDRPESRVVDRALLEAVVLALRDPALVPPALAEAIGRRVSHDAQLGLERLGYAADPSKRGLAVRLVEHAHGCRLSCVKPALADVALTGRVAKVRERVPSGVRR